MKNVIKFNEQGFCFGVSRSIEIVNNVLKNNNVKKPIYLLGHLVHNFHVNDYFASLGIIILNEQTRLKMLDQINSGTVIITAHGVSNKVIEKAKNKGLDIVDATCPYVIKTVNNIKNKSKEGFKILYIGKTNHPETETIIDEIEDVIVIDQNKSIPKIKNVDTKYILAHQTTLSDYDVKNIASALCKKYSNIEVLEQVCIFPEKRQQEINNYMFPNESNLIIVVGDKISNNATKLVEITKRKNVGDVIMLSNCSEVDKVNVSNYDNIYITSATSTPLSIVDEIYNEIKEKKSNEEIN